MKDIPDPDNGQDDIDRIVDALLQHPERASDLKDLLRHKIIAPDVVTVATPVAAVPDPADTSGADDFWDNVPV